VLKKLECCLVIDVQEMLISSRKFVLKTEKFITFRCSTLFIMKLGL